MDPMVTRLLGAAMLLGAALFWNPANPLWLALLTWAAFALGAIPCHPCHVCVVFI